MDYSSPHKPEVSIIIPLYNKESSIKSTIESVLNQTYENFEVIVLNDGSTDGSLNIVRSIVDPRIRIIDKANEGVSKTRNRGVEDSCADLIAFLDADDKMCPDCIKYLLDLRKAFPDCDLWAGRFANVYEGKVISYFGSLEYGIVKHPHRAWFFEKWQIRTGNFIMTKKSFLELGGFSNIISVGEDLVLFDEFLARYTAAYTPQITMEYLQDNRALSTGGKPIKNLSSNYFSFKNKNIWQKLIYSQIILKNILTNAPHGRFDTTKAYVKKYKFWIMLGFIAMLLNMPTLLRKVLRGGGYKLSKV